MKNFLFKKVKYFSPRIKCAIFPLNGRTTMLLYEEDQQDIFIMTRVDVFVCFYKNLFLSEK